MRRTSGKLAEKVKWVGYAGSSQTINSSLEIALIDRRASYQHRDTRETMNNVQNLHFHATVRDRYAFRLACPSS